MKFLNALDKKMHLLMILPAVLAIAFVHIYPSLASIHMSFFDINLLRPARPFIGLNNYVEALNNPIVRRVLLNTLFWSVASLAIGCSFALFVANRLNRAFRGRAFFRTLYLAPWVTPPIVVAMVWQQIMSRNFSPISGALQSLGIIEHPINFLGDVTLHFGFLSIPMISLIVINVWSMFPFCMVMFLAALQTIPPEPYEAAQVDGATRMQQFWRITAPLLFPVIQTTILLQGIWQFNSFNLSFLVTHGGPLNSTELMSVRVYNEAFNHFRYGYGAAISVIMLFVVFIPAAFYIVRAVQQERASR